MEPTAAPDPAGLVSVHPMVRLANAAVDSVVHASAVSEAVPDHQVGDDAAGDKEPSQPTWQGPRYVHGRTVPAKSPIRVAAAPMPIAPAVPPMTAMPTPAATLAHQLDRRGGSDFGRVRLGWGKWSGLYRHSAESYQAGECRNHRAHFSLHRGKVARMVRDND